MHACHAVKQYCAQTQMCRAARAARRREEKEEQSRAVESERTNERMNDYRGEWTCRLDADQASVAARLSACLLPTYLGSCRTTQVTDGLRTAASCASEEHTSGRASRQESESKVRTDFQYKKTRPCAAATADRHRSEPRHGDPVCVRHDTRTRRDDEDFLEYRVSVKQKSYVNENRADGAKHQPICSCIRQSHKPLPPSLTPSSSQKRHPCLHQSPYVEPRRLFGRPAGRRPRFRVRRLGVHAVARRPVCPPFRPPTSLDLRYSRLFDLLDLLKKREN
ncbi:hypothetical protein IWZ01DRAFT_126903 [Phyllosticta capitalensis]